jgi:hypothetical protein
MISLLDQLKEQLTELFANREDDYNKTIVKKAYENLPKGQYPRVIISELSNNSVMNRETSEGERTTLLGYQFAVYSRDMTDYEASDSVNFMIHLIDDYIQEHYKMSRISVTGVQPYIVDSTVMSNISRYTCVYDKETNLIYIN